MAWGKAGSVETTGASLTVTSVLDSKFYTFLYNSIPSGDMTEYMRLGSGSADTLDSYANRKSTNGGAEGAYNTRSNMVVSAKSGATQPELGVGYIFNRATEEKLMIYHAVNANASGAGTAPDRIEVAGKWVNTSDVMDVIQMYDVNGVGDYDTGSNLSVLGSDLTPAAASPATILDGLIFEETDTNKHYIYTSGAWTEL